ncbi:DUF3822 family protein [Flavicella sediminum]|uniref:DUF3822 family protein n=1 Tax=Flavicella sediminum TaxID=2585141 RepID=UPI00111EAE62|nr:DUF3822 family protein [Flavicella sediminum]
METGRLSMTKPNNKTHSKSLEKNDLKETYLSIQISLDGFSFCIYDRTSSKYIAFEAYSLEHLEIQNPESLLAPLQAIFEENVLLQQNNFKKVSVHYNNELSTIVPQKYFSEDKLDSYLTHTIKVLATDFIAFDEIDALQANAVYIPYVNINNYLFSLFGSFEYKHSSSVLLETLSNKFKATQAKKMCVNVSSSSFQIVVLEEGKLLFFNAFHYQTAEDFIYYILFVCEQLQLDTNSIDTLLFGDIEKESELFRIAYQYIRNINFYQEINEKTSELEITSKHAHYTLLNQF